MSGPPASIDGLREELIASFAAASAAVSLSMTDAEATARFEDHVLAKMYRHVSFLHSGIHRADGMILYRIIRSWRLERTMEVGSGFGFSALFCLQAHADNGSGQHVAIDPNQRALDARTLERNRWDAGAVTAVKNAGLDPFFHHLDTPDFLGLPELVRQGRAFDLVLFDAMPLFDTTLVNCYFADLLLKVGGVLAVDVVKPEQIKALRYWLRNRHFQVIRVEAPGGRLVLLRKLGVDDRAWDGPFVDF